MWDLASGQERPDLPAEAVYYRLDNNGYLWVKTVDEPEAIPRGWRVLKRFAAARRALLEGRPEGQAANTLVLWDLTANKPMGHWPETIRPVSEFVASPDGRYLAFRDAIDGSTVRTWDWITSRLSRPLMAREGQEFALFGLSEISPNGALLADIAAHGGDAVLRVWDVETSAELLSLPRTGQKLAWAAAGRVLITEGPPTKLAPGDRRKPQSPQSAGEHLDQYSHVSLVSGAAHFCYLPIRSCSPLGTGPSGTDLFPGHGRPIAVVQ